MLYLLAVVVLSVSLVAGFIRIIAGTRPVTALAPVRKRTR
jgi:hypothetical protein